MKKIAFIISAVIFLFLFLAIFYKPFSVGNNLSPKNSVYKNIIINGASIKAELAITAKERMKGLSGRRSLKDDEGMLFVFERPDFHTFWMKDMNFPIDIIWISEEMRIADIARDARPESFPENFLPKRQAKYVLEVNSGWAEKNGAEEGDIVTVK